MADYFKQRSAQEVAAIRAHFRKLMAEAGLPYGDRSMTYNSRLAQELGSWADSQETGADIHDLLYKAYFVDNHNISDIEVLIDLAGEAGLDQIEARRILEGRLFGPQVDEDWRRAWQAGITGVPTFTSNELVVVGCQPYETLERFVNHLRELQAQEHA